MKLCAIAAMCLGAVVAFAGLAIAKEAEGAKGWTPLFNGKDFEGWKKPSGKAIWKVEDGCLVGTQTDGNGGDLFTEKEWGNFELRFTYKVAWPANTGIWFRGQYQYDILKYTNPVGFSGTLYMPGYPKTFITQNLDEKLENRDDWNEGQVYANGDHLILWLNGHKVGDCHNKTHAKGPVGIQVHGGDGFKGMKITLKRIEIRPLKPDDKPTEPAPAKPKK
ncbi:MAG TPA: DUF1080 domain-containing protein [Phycisphaerae bacterium]|nr:DUF1080 domain-containing protein [Phycisphaerae bacterium]